MAERLHYARSMKSEGNLRLCVVMVYGIFSM